MKNRYRIVQSGTLFFIEQRTFLWFYRRMTPEYYALKPCEVTVNGMILHDKFKESRHRSTVIKYYK